MYRYQIEHTEFCDQYKAMRIAESKYLLSKKQSAQDKTYSRLSEALDELMMMPAPTPWTLQQKLQLFESEILNVNIHDGGKESYKWYGSIKADVLSLITELQQLKSN